MNNPTKASTRPRRPRGCCKAFVRYKTMNIVVHKDAIPAHIKAKLGISDSKAAPAKKGKNK